MATTDGEPLLELAPGLTLVPVRHEAVLHDTRRAVLHELNAAAATICCAADGTRTLAEVAEVCQRRFHGPPDEIERDVVVGVETLIERGLLRRISPEGRVVAQNP